MSKRTMSASVFVFIIGVAAQSFAVTDDFESYDTGNIDGQGDWIDFGGTLLTNVSTDQALSGTKALKLTINPVDPNPFDIPGYGSDVYQDLPTEHTTGT